MASSKCVGPPPATNSGECLVVDFIELVYGRLVVRVVSPENEATIVEVLKKNFSGVRESPPFSEVRAGDHYMGRLDIESGIILRRIQVTEGPGEDLDAPIKCVDIDNGESVKVQWYNLFVLKDDAMNFPRQTFDVFPSGMELIFGTSYLARVMDEPPQRYILKVVNPRDGAPPKCHVTTYGVRREVPVVHLYYANAPLLSAVVVAEGKVSTAFKCVQPMVGEEVKVIVTHLVNDGSFIYQYEKCLVKSIQAYLGKIEWSQGQVARASNTRPDTVYLSKFEGALYRCQVIKVVSEDKVLVVYIDYGNEGEIPVRDMMEAETVQRLLSLIPPQCLRAKLTGIGHMKSTDDFWEVAGMDRFILKIDNVPEGSFRRPRVSLYLRGKLETSVNDVLLEKGLAFIKKPSRSKQKDVVPVPPAGKRDVPPTPAEIVSSLVSIVTSAKVTVTPAMVLPISTAVIAPTRAGLGAKSPPVVVTSPPVVVTPRSPVVVTSPPVVVTPVVTPRPAEIVTPRPAEIVTPRPAEIVTPRPAEIVTPRPAEIVTPRPAEIVTPRPAEIVTFRPPVVISPRPPAVVAPRPPVVVTPRPPAVTTARPPGVVTPRPPVTPANRPAFVAPIRPLVPPPPVPTTSSAPLAPVPKTPLTSLNSSFDKNNGSFASEEVDFGKFATSGAVRLADWADVSEFFTTTESQTDGELALFHVTQVFGDNLALRQHKSGNLLLDMETTLGEYLQVKVAGGRNAVRLVEHKWYAVFYQKLDKWTRCVLLKKETLDGIPVAIFRLMDYGLWFSLPLESDSSAGPDVQELPLFFTHLKPQGVTASLSCVRKEGISAKILDQVDKPLVQVRIQKYLPPGDGRDIPHAKISVLRIVNGEEKRRVVRERKNSI